MAPSVPAFDTSRVSALDATATMRSLRRRFAEAFEQADCAERVMGHPVDGGLSPLEHAAWTAAALEAIRSAFHHVQVADNPQIELPPVEAAAVGGEDATPPEILARLGENARALGDAMAGVHGKDWSRTGQLTTGTISALEIARLAVRIGVEHLRAAERTIFAG